MAAVPDSAPRSRSTTRLGVVLAALLALGAVLWTTGATEAAATPADEAAFVDALNVVRIEAGLTPLTLNAELGDLAREHARQMADRGEIFHADPISAGYDGEWVKIGENVGSGANVSVLVDAFIASPGHYANIIDPAFSEIGVGVVWRDGALYTTHRFLQVAEEVAASPAPPIPAPTVPVPAPTTTVAQGDTTPVVPGDPTAEPGRLAATDVHSARIVALLDLLSQVGT